MIIRTIIYVVGFVALVVVSKELGELLPEKSHLDGWLLVFGYALLSLAFWPGEKS